MTLDSIMTRHVVTVGTEDSLRVVREMFERYRFHHVVVQENGNLAGIISDRDLYTNISPFIGSANERSQDTASLHRKANQIMSKALLTGKPDMKVSDAALLMLNNRVSCLPVVDEFGACVGIVTTRDMMRWALAVDSQANRAGQAKNAPACSDALAA